MEPNDDAVDLFTSSGVVNLRPDVRIGGRHIDGNSNILAFNYFPNNGDMVIDTNDSFYNDTSNNSLKFRNVLAHEHGHGIGIGHVCPVQQTKLMEPFVSTQFDGPQHDDIRAGQRLYGDRFEDNDTTGTATDLGVLGISTSGQGLGCQLGWQQRQRLLHVYHSRLQFGSHDHRDASGGSATSMALRTTTAVARRELTSIHPMIATCVLSCWTVAAQY